MKAQKCSLVMVVLASTLCLKAVSASADIYTGTKIPHKVTGLEDKEKESLSLIQSQEPKVGLVVSSDSSCLIPDCKRCKSEKDVHTNKTVQTCEECADSFFKDQGFCVFCTQHCEKCSKYQTCDECFYGYSKGKNDYCVPTYLGIYSILTYYVMPALWVGVIIGAIVLIKKK